MTNPVARLDQYANLERTLRLRCADLARAMALRVLPQGGMRQFMSIPGWTTSGQLRHLRRLVTSLPDGSLIAEIGVWQGRSAIAMADACRGTSKKVFAVD